jgi:hypothetical protein
MRFFKLTLIVALCVAGGYFWFERQKAGSLTAPVKQLSGLVEIHQGRIFSPLDEGDPGVSSRELLEIQRRLRDQQARASTEKERAVSTAGLSLSSVLLTALSEREQHAKRLAANRSKRDAATLANPDHAQRDTQHRREFFEGGIHRSWEAASQRIRPEAERYASSLRMLQK